MKHSLGYRNYRNIREVKTLVILALLNLTEPFPNFNPKQAKAELQKVLPLLDEVLETPDTEVQP